MKLLAVDKEMNVEIEPHCYEIEEFKKIDQKEILESISTYMCMANGFLEKEEERRQTIIDEICWDLHGIFTFKPEIKEL
ncbi:MAG: hypothetical protein EBR82_56060, partial [Caulobacteraceae bacterium]|nr:hypothetical protein [Caulobacteraceae bacterium]